LDDPSRVDFSIIRSYLKLTTILLTVLLDALSGAASTGHRKRLALPNASLADRPSLFVDEWAADATPCAVA
jgi:ABC-type siderophore export system fused ATPase/permease subunit